MLVADRSVINLVTDLSVINLVTDRSVAKLDLAMTTNRAAVGESDEIDYLRSATKLTNYQISKGIQPE